MTEEHPGDVTLSFDLEDGSRLVLEADGDQPAGDGPQEIVVRGTLILPPYHGPAVADDPPEVTMTGGMQLPEPGGNSG